MSASHPKEPLKMPSSEVAINNNDASILNQNLTTIVKEASRVQSLLSKEDPLQNDATFPDRNRNASYNEDVKVSLSDSPLIPFTDEDLPKSILKPRPSNTDGLDSKHELTDSNLQESGIKEHHQSSLPKRSFKYSTDSNMSSQNMKFSESDSQSKIPVPVSTIKRSRSGRKRSRKNSITKVAGEFTASCENLFEAMACDEDITDNMSEDYIDDIIQQSSKKSIDRGLDSTGDFLDDSEEVFEEEERSIRKEVCNNIVMKFLELTEDKRKSNNLSPAVCLTRHESKGATPVLNLNFKRLDDEGTTRSMDDEFSNIEAGNSKNLENRMPLYESDVEDVGDKQDGEIETYQLELVVKGLENKVASHEHKIDDLEHQLKISKTAAVDKDLECEQLRREVNLLVSRPEKSYEGVERKESSHVEHLVKGLENKLALNESKMESLEDQLKIAKTSVEDKDKTCEELARELKVIESERSNLVVKTKDMDLEVSVKKTKLSDQDEELRTLKAKHSLLETELNDKDNKYEMLESKRKESEQLINVYEIEVKSSKTKLEMSEDVNEKLKDEIKVKSCLIDVKSTEIEERKRQVEVLETDIAKFENSYHDANMRLIKQTQECEAKDVETRDLVTKVKDLEREVLSFNKQNLKYEEKMKDLEQHQFKNKRALFEKSEDKVDLSCRKCETFEKKLKTLEKKLEKSEEDLKSKLEKQDVLTNVNNELKSEIGESLIENKNLVDENKANDVLLIANESEIQGCKNKIGTLENEIMKREIKLKNTNERLEALSFNGEDYDRNLNVTKANVVKMELLMETLKAENFELKETNKILEEDFKVHDRLVRATDEKLSKCGDALEAITKDFDANRNELKITLDDLNSVKASKQELEIKYEKLVEDHQTVRRKLSEVETKSEECERNLVKLEKENEKLYEDWTNEKSKNDTVTQGLEDEVSQLMML